MSVVIVSVMMACVWTPSATARETYLAEKESLNLVFCCAAENDLYRVMAATETKYARLENPLDAVRAAGDGAGVLILADGYPQETTIIEPAVFEEAARKKLRLYVEYPSALPEMNVGKPRQMRLERGVVTSEVFGEGLRPMRIVMINDCHLVDVPADNPHLVMAKVAGFDTAVFGLKDAKTYPVLFEHRRGDLLVSTTKLSQFVTGRYMPQETWATVWRMILGWLQPDKAVPKLNWTPSVRPSFARDDTLPADVERQALVRSAQWIIRSRILRHGDWPQKVLDWSNTYNTVKEPPPEDWPTGDGSLGILEGYSSTILHDGSQPMRYAVRNDCMGEVAMELAFHAALSKEANNGRLATNILDYTLASFTKGPRAEPENPSFGLVSWSLDYPNSYWGDDNARAMLGVLATAALLDDPRWDEAMARCLLANLRTSGIYGYREACVQHDALQQRGWKSYWTGRHVHYSPHYQGWIWACYLWAYDKTGYEPFLTRSKTALGMLMRAYPDRWFWCNRSEQIERARALLPLAWLVRVEDTPEHRRWLRTVAGDLLRHQDRSGAIQETLGGTEHGVSSNAAYGTGETTILQRNGDPLCDLLYTCNFALIGLHEAAAASGDSFYADAEEKLAKFLCRIQIRSEAHPELDGAWYRGFDFRRWEYWASNADWEWGPWCTETGWTQPWIAGTLALRQMKTSLWELTAGSKIAPHLDKYQRSMLPKEALPLGQAKTAVHAARGKRVELVNPPDARYGGGGTAGLTDGLLGTLDYTSPEWLGFHGADLQATIDFGRPVAIAEIAVRFLQSTGVGIFLPKRVEFGVSDDGTTFRSLQTVVSEVSPRKAGPLVATLAAEDLKVRARYVRVRAVNIATIPDWHPAKGIKAWLFVDEVVVRGVD